MELSQWIASHWTAFAALVGGTYTLYKLGSVITAVVSLIVSVTGRLKTAEQTLSLLATNHLPHLQAEMEKINTKQDRTNEVLSEIHQDLLLVLMERMRVVGC